MPAPAPAPAPTWRFDHVNVVTNAHPQALAFFRDVMGLTSGQRPDFGFPGDWLYQQGEACVHAMHTGAPDPGAAAEPLPELRLHHLAFRSDEPAADVLKRVRDCGLPHRVATLPGRGDPQIFVTLPGGLLIELTTRA